MMIADGFHFMMAIAAISTFVLILEISIIDGRWFCASIVLALVMHSFDHLICVTLSGLGAGLDPNPQPRGSSLQTKGSRDFRPNMAINSEPSLFCMAACFWFFWEVLQGLCFHWYPLKSCRTESALLWYQSGPDISVQSGIASFTKSVRFEASPVPFL